MGAISELKFQMETLSFIAEIFVATADWRTLCIFSIGSTCIHTGTKFFARATMIGFLKKNPA